MAARFGQIASLGEFVRRRRSELGLTQEELAERIGGGMRQSDVSRLERGRVMLPRLERLEQIARALDSTPGELLAAAGWLEGGAVEAPPHREDENASPAVDMRDRFDPGFEDFEQVRLQDALTRSAQIQQRSSIIMNEARAAIARARRARGKQR